MTPEERAGVRMREVHREGPKPELVSRATWDAYRVASLVCVTVGVSVCWVLSQPDPTDAGVAVVVWVWVFAFLI